MIRAIHLADIVPLLLFLSKSPVDVARPRGSTCGEGVSALPLLRNCLTSSMKQCSFACVHRGLIDALVSYRSCRGPAAWEIESLLMGTGREDCCQSLLDGAGPPKEAPGGRLFLRVESGSQGLEIARKAGFGQYVTEFEYVFEAASNSPPVNASLALKPKTSADEYGLFRLYNAAVPLRVRNVEGITFQEWCESRERRPAREWLVHDEDGEITACLKVRIAGASARFSLISAQASGDLEPLVDHCLAFAGGKKSVSCFVQDHQAGLRQVLEYKGFRQVVEYACLSKQAAVRVRDPRLVPLRA
ncbi:MAG: hypothetical protein IBX68_06805 [Dehalococcoidia bacterium]|nr:hypothetical protein [Dehalococcoidia bacterium]